MEALPAAVASGACPLPAGSALASTLVLPTAARQACAQLAELPLPRRGARAEPEAAAAAACVLLHLGVHSTAAGFRLERCAWNDASFRCADEAGWAPQGERVCEADALGHCRATRLPVDALAAALQAQGWPVVASVDPGRCVRCARCCGRRDRRAHARRSAAAPRAWAFAALLQPCCPLRLTPLLRCLPSFVCNYTFYSSLARAEAEAAEDAACDAADSDAPPPPPAWHALFVHVPPVSAVPLPEQMRFLAALLAALALHLQTAP